MNKKFLVGAAAFATLTVGGTIVGVAAADDQQVPPQARIGSSVNQSGVDDSQLPTPSRSSESAQITHDQAVAIAQGVVAGGRVTETELEDEHGRLVWEVELTASGIEHEVHVDAKTGGVLKSEADHARQEDDADARIEHGRSSHGRDHHGDHENDGDSHSDD